MAKKDYIIGHELFDLILEIADPEIFDLLKLGLQPYHQTTYEKIYDSDKLERKQRNTLEEIELNQRAKRRIAPIGRGGRPPLSDSEIKRLAERIFNEQRWEIVDPPNYHRSFSNPTDVNEFTDAVAFFKNCWYKNSEVREFIYSIPKEKLPFDWEAIKTTIEALKKKRDQVLDRLEALSSKLSTAVTEPQDGAQDQETSPEDESIAHNSNHSPSPPEPPESVSEPSDGVQDQSLVNVPIQKIKSDYDIEVLVKEIRISPVNDNGIEIQEAPGKKWKSVDISTWGPKAPGVLIRYLGQSITPPHTFTIGQTDNMDNSRNLLVEIEKKIIRAFPDHLSSKLPKGYRLSMRIKGEPAGTRKFKFKVISRDDQTKFDRLSKDEILNEIGKAADSITVIRYDTVLDDQAANEFIKRALGKIKDLIISAKKKGVAQKDIDHYIKPIQKEWSPAETYDSDSNQQDHEN